MGIHDNPNAMGINSNHRRDDSGNAPVGMTVRTMAAKDTMVIFILNHLFTFQSDGGFLKNVHQIKEIGKKLYKKVQTRSDLNEDLPTKPTFPRIQRAKHEVKSIETIDTKSLNIRVLLFMEMIF